MGGMLAIQNVFYLAITIALFINGTFILLNKLGALDWLRMRVENKFFSKMLDCYFCLSHHLAVLAITPILIYDFNALYLLVPLMVAGIINLLN
jgi:hypothetical protein